MVKSRLVFACLWLVFMLPLQAFQWGTATYNGRDYVTLQSFCAFYGFGYQIPSGNDFFRTRNSEHTIGLKVGTSDLYLDGVHYVMSFPVENGDRDWLVSRMDVIKLFEPVLRPTEISGRHSIRGVVIDAGHGGSDNGAVSARGGAEKNYTLDTAFRLEAILRNEGLKTVLTRSNDVFVDLYERAHIASLYPDYAFVSIHYNSASEEARGLETYCLSPRGAASTSSAYLTRSDIQKLPGNDDDAMNILLASMVHSEIIRLNPGDPTADRGVKRARFVVIKQNVLPAILVEGGFVSNRMEAARVNRPDYRQTLADAIARGVIRFVNVMGDRRLPLPGPSQVEENVAEAPAPRAIAVVPPAPSGLARESRGVRPVPVVASTNSVAATPGHKLRKTRKTLASKKDKLNPGTNAVPVAPNTPAVTSSSDSENTTTFRPTPKATSTPLDLAEPATPTPSAGGDKAGAEPDEPPTVNIYPTGSAKSPGGAEDPGPAPSSPPSSVHGGNATTNSAPSTPEPTSAP